MPKYSEAMFRKDLAELSSLIDTYVYTARGGRPPVHMRSFTVHTVGGKPYTGDDIRVTINRKKPGRPMRKNPAKPKDAARHAYHSICENLGFKKFNCDIVFTIKETTRGSKNKVYGPYEGSRKKLSKAVLAEYAKKHKKGDIKFVPQSEITIRKVDAPRKGGAKRKTKRKASKKKRSVKRKAPKRKASKKKASRKGKKKSSKKKGGYYFYN